MSNMTSTVEAENQFSNMQTKLKGEIDKLELQIQQQNSKIESLSNLSTITETDLKRQLVLLSEKNENCERQRDSYYSELLSVKNDNTSMTNQLSELNYLLTNKDNESKKTYELIKTLREQLDQLRLSSQSDLDALRSTNSSLMIENDNCKYQIGSLQKEIEKFKLFVTNMIQSTARELTLENITVSVEGNALFLLIRYSAAFHLCYT